MKQSGKNYKRIVIKIGSSLLHWTDDQRRRTPCPMEAIAAQVSDLIERGVEVVLVSSGAIASGMRILKMRSRPKDLSGLQAVAAVGQHLLMREYQRFFEKRGRNCAQLLLTWDDFDERRRYLNAKHTLSKLLELKSVPIINENDTVSTDEIRFGDNDQLSARVAALVDADLLIILSDVDGLLDRNKAVIPLVDEITPQIKNLACPTDKEICVGGMITKIDAAKIAVDSGIPCVIANGRSRGVILSVINEPQKYGTLFVPKKGLDERQRWIAFGTKPKGRIYVDEGARRALVNKKSLLAVGVTAVEGNFVGGEIVSLLDRDGNEFARGKAGVSGSELDKVKGKRYAKEILHCDNIVIL